MATRSGVRSARIWRRASRPSRLARAGRPGSASCIVGNDPASQIYVRNKIKSGAETQLFAELIELPETATLDELLAVVARLNASPLHDGILVQSPLPKAMGPTRRNHGVRGDRSRQGRRRLQPGERRPPRSESRVIDGMYARRRDGDPAPLGHRSRGQARRRDRPQRHRRQADGADAAARERHGDHLSFAHERPAGDRARGGHPRRRARARRLRHDGFRQAGRDGDRRRHQSRHRRGAGRVALS